ncbi:hypothetical protein [Salinibacter ruber]|uniref:hypothetical protein n=1 Tax=Salinibacter ruber TaxID=146919 RepID=UPI000DD9CE05|nr:hypothetical protein [Salinibacter ruber]MCS4097488.1 hypothetical protein [Salinibacter ruber]MCS4154122.1 hypothetical protein [Salinibacter ruber]
MSSSIISLLRQLNEEGFNVKITDGGVIAHLSSRKPSRHELVDAVPELDGCPMEMTEDGVFISVGEEQLSL